MAKGKSLLEQFEEQDKVNMAGKKSLLDQFEEQDKPSQPVAEIPPTLEESLGFNTAYDVAGAAQKVLAPIAKLQTVPTALVMGTLSGGPSQGLSAAKNELTSWNPTPEGSMSSYLGKIDSLSKPIMDTPIQDVNQGQTLKAGAKLWAEQNFPNAYNFAKRVSPADILGTAADTMTGHLLGKAINPLTRGAAGHVKNVAYTKAVDNAEKAIERMSSLTSSAAEEASNSLKTKKAAMTALDYGLSDKLTNPVELQKALNGSSDVVYDKLKGKKVARESLGIIQGLTDDVNGLADKSSETVGKINIKNIENSIFEELNQNLGDPNSGATWNENTAKITRSKINNFFKTTPFDIEDIRNEIQNGNTESALQMHEDLIRQNNRNFKGLVKLKRAAADKVYEINKNPEIYGVEGATDKAIFKSIWNNIDSHINSYAGTDINVAELVKKNSDLSDLLHLKDITSKARLKSLSKLSLPEMAVGAVAGGAIGQAVGHPIAGALTYPAVRAAGRIGETSIPSYLARPQMAVSEMAGRLSKNPQASQNIASFAAGSKASLPSQLINYQIPRNSKEILANKDMVIAKIAQMSNNPDMVQSFTNVLYDHPDLLNQALPALVVQFPTMFDRDKYDRIDNKILDPMMKQKALKDLQNDLTIGVREKAARAKMLNETGVLSGY